MHSPCLKVKQYTNLLKPLSVIGIDFMESLQEQQQALRQVRLFGIYPMLTLTSIAGEIHPLILNGVKEKSFSTQTRRST